MLFEATNNFSNDHKIGTGSFFLVYHASLDDGRKVAIKCKNGACACEINLKALSCHSHNNLVCLLGFCDDSIKPIQVYEYMKNGSLHDHLHKLQSSPLMVEMGALDYMDHKYTRHLTLHNATDIKKIATLKERQWHMLGPQLWIV